MNATAAHRVQFENLLKNKQPIIKYGRNFKPHTMELFVSGTAPQQRVCWGKKKFALVSDMEAVVPGCTTKIFGRVKKKDENLCFSLMFNSRTLDIQLAGPNVSSKLRDLYVGGFEWLKWESRKGSSVGNGKASVKGPHIPNNLMAHLQDKQQKVNGDVFTSDDEDDEHDFVDPSTSTAAKASLKGRASAKGSPRVSAKLVLSTQSKSASPQGRRNSLPNGFNTFLKPDCRQPRAPGGFCLEHQDTDKQNKPAKGSSKGSPKSSKNNKELELDSVGDFPSRGCKEKAKEKAKSGNRRRHSSIAVNGICVIPGCDQRRVKSSYCNKHYTEYVEGSSHKELKDVIKHELGLRYFKEQMASEFSSENINFWDAVEKYHVISDIQENKQKQLLRANEIVKQYVIPDAPQWVNINADMRNKIIKLVNEQHGNRILFDDAQTEIYNLMSSDTFHRFTNSALYSKFKEDKMMFDVKINLDLEAARMQVLRNQANIMKGQAEYAMKKSPVSAKNNHLGGS